jgi:hypothetical protein
VICMGEYGFAFRGEKKVGKEGRRGICSAGGDDQVRKADENMRAYFCCRCGGGG